MKLQINYINGDQEVYGSEWIGQVDDSNGVIRLNKPDKSETIIIPFDNVKSIRRTDLRSTI